MVVGRRGEERTDRDVDAARFLVRVLAVPEVRRHSRWFWSYLLVSSVVYTEWKNIIARVAQVKELLGEHQWNVTPRTTETPNEVSA